MAKNKGKNSIISFIAMLLLLYIVGPLLLGILIQEYFGSVGELITSAIDVIPFGKAFYLTAIQILNSIAGQVVSYNNMSGFFSIGYFFGELAKGLFTLIVFEFFRLPVCLLLGFVDDKGEINPEGLWNKAKYVLLLPCVALIAAFLAPSLLSYIFSNFPSIGNIWSGIISFIISIVLVGGGISFFAVLHTWSVAKAAFYVLLKFFMVGAFRLTTSYVLIFMVLIFWENGFYFISVESATALLTLAIMLAGIEKLIDVAFH